jgi:hypothetical protein
MPVVRRADRMKLSCSSANRWSTRGCRVHVPRIPATCRSTASTKGESGTGLTTMPLGHPALQDSVRPTKRPTFVKPDDAACPAVPPCPWKWWAALWGWRGLAARARRWMWWEARSRHCHGDDCGPVSAHERPHGCGSAFHRATIPVQQRPSQYTSKESFLSSSSP